MRRIGLLAMASVSAWAIVTPVYAQNAEGGASVDDNNAIVVTARRVEERLQDVPISITVFNQEQISNRNVVTANDLVRYTPSLSSNTRYGSDTASYSIRGFVQEANTAPSVAMYFADVISPRAQGTTGGGNSAPIGAFFDLQNVQVLKGPQGTLFGRNTTGGAVLLVPQKPTSDFEGYVEGSIGSYDLRRVQAVLNVPLGDNLRVRLGADSNTRDGWLHNVSDIGPRDFADVNYLGLRLSVVADLTPDLENYTIVSYGRSNTNGYYVKVINQDNRVRDPFPAERAAQIAATSGNFYDVSNGNPSPKLDIRQWSVINTTTWRASDTLTIKNIASYSQYRLTQRQNIYGENSYTNARGVPFYILSLSNGLGRDNISQQTFTEELQLQGGSADGDLTYQAGAYFERSDPLDGFQTTVTANTIACTSVSNLICANPTGRGVVSISNGKYHFRDYGVYAQATYKITNTISVTGGLRYTWDKVSGLGQGVKFGFPAVVPGSPITYTCTQPASQVTGGTSAEVQADPSRCNYRRKGSDDKPTWLIDIDWKPSEDVMLYGKYARGYRQGGINIASYGLETWSSEKVDLFEVGAKTSFDGFLTGYFNIAAFYNDFSNQQIAANALPCSVFLPTNPNACGGLPPTSFPAATQGIANGGKSVIKGVEVDASLRLFEGFRVDASYAYLNTKLKSITLPATPLGFAALTPNSLPGGRLALTPSNKLSLTASYTLPVDEDIGRITLAATFTYQSDQFGTPTSVGALQTLPSQRNLNLNLNWNSVAGRPVDLSLFVTNATKEKYYTYLAGASFGFESAVLNEPRMFGARVKVRFGD